MFHVKFRTQAYCQNHNSPEIAKESAKMRRETCVKQCWRIKKNQRKSCPTFPPPVRNEFYLQRKIQAQTKNSRKILSSPEIEWNRRKKKLHVHSNLIKSLIELLNWLKNLSSSSEKFPFCIVESCRVWWSIFFFWRISRAFCSAENLEKWKIVWLTSKRS